MFISAGLFFMRMFDISFENSHEGKNNARIRYVTPVLYNFAMKFVGKFSIRKFIYDISMGKTELQE